MDFIFGILFTLALLFFYVRSRNKRAARVIIGQVQKDGSKVWNKTKTTAQVGQCYVQDVATHIKEGFEETRSKNEEKRAKKAAMDAKIAAAEAVLEKLKKEAS